jgi:hypothetical protein
MEIEIQKQKNEIIKLKIADEKNKKYDNAHRVLV